MSARKLDKVLKMLLNQDNLLAVLSPDTFGNRPTSDFFTLNSLYGAEYSPEDAEVEVGHYAQAYKSYTLENMPTKTGVYAFHVHSGTCHVRFTEVDVELSGEPLYTCFFGANLEDWLKKVTCQYQIIGTYVKIYHEWNGHVIKVY